jgi:hypothetical protein
MENRSSGRLFSFLSRKDVQKMIEESEKVDKYKFKYNSGLDYCPFQK